MPSAWTRLRAAADPFTRRYLGLYAAYPLTRAEYVGTYQAPAGVASCRDWLRAQGYRPQRLSAAKRHPETGALHVLSMRKVPGNHPTDMLDYLPYESDKRPAIYKDWRPRDCQYHVHAFPSATGEGLDVYSHYELRPDFLRPRPNPERLRTHYRPRYGEDYLRGVSDLDL